MIGLNLISLFGGKGTLSNTYLLFTVASNLFMRIIVWESVN